MLFFAGLDKSMQQKICKKLDMLDTKFIWVTFVKNL